MNCGNIASGSVFDRVMSEYNGSEMVIVIEDIVVYGGMRVRQQTLDTCKVIGELMYRFGADSRVSAVHLIPRPTVKKWIFEAANDIVRPRVDAIIAAKHRRRLSKGQKGFMSADGSMRAASFQFVGDREVIAALKYLYDIPTPKPGKSNVYGLKAHSWQALAMAAHFAHNGKDGA